MRKQKHYLAIPFQPIFYLLLAFVVGILLQHWLSLSITLTGSTLLTAIIVAGISYYYSRSWSTLIAVCIGFIAVGALMLIVEQTAQRRIAVAYQAVGIDQEAPIEIYGEITAPPVTAPSRVYLDLDTHLIKSPTKVIALHTSIRVTLWLADRGAETQYQQLALGAGNWIRVQATPYPKQMYKNPGAFDEDWLAAKGYDLAVSVKHPAAIEVLSRCSPPLFSSLIGQARQYCQARIDAHFEPRLAGVMKAAILGNGYYLSQEIAEDFRAAGIYHILIISGSHIGLIALMFNWLLSQFIERRVVVTVIVIAGIASYGLLVGGDTPVMRAVIMTAIALIARTVERRAWPINTLGLAGLILLAYRPSSLFETGFQLTFVAVSAILLIALPLTEQLIAIGSWRLRYRTPYPPQCSPIIRWVAELLWWQPQIFARDLKESPIRYRLEKNRWASWLEWSYLQKPLRALVVLLLTSSIVQLAMLPLSAYYFHRMAFIGIPLTIVTDLLMSLLLSVFSIFLVVDAFLPSLSHFFAGLLGWITELFIISATPGRLIDRTGWLSLLSYRVADLQWAFSFVYLCYYLSLIRLIISLNCWHPFAAPTNLVRRWYRHWPHYLALAGLFGLMFLILNPAILNSRRQQTGQLEITFLDVGQGDAAFILFPDGTTMMVDSGGKIQFKSSHATSSPEIAHETDTFSTDSASIGEVVDSQYLWWRGIERLDYIVATHAHLDHIEGFQALIKNFSIGQAIVSGRPRNDVEFNHFTEQLQHAAVQWKVWSQGDRFVIGGVDIEVLWPPSQPVPTQLGNDQSLVLRLSYGQHTFLLAGDIEAQAERALVASTTDLTSDVLKVPHHGSKTSSGEQFLYRVKPAIAIIPAPIHSRFNHPNAEVVKRYQDFGTKVYQTGRVGAVTVATDGNQLQISTFDQHSFP